MLSSDIKKKATTAAAIQLPEEEFELDETLVTENNYPTGKVILMYLLFGGPIGGAFLMSLVLIESFALEDFYLIFAGLFLGFIFGVIPATLAGFLIASFKLHCNAKGLLWSAIIGACTTIIVAISIGSDALAILSVILIGAISAVLTGLFALPKLELKG